MNSVKKRFKVPDTYALLLFFIIFASILTYIVPAGAYGVLDNGSIDGTSFNLIDQTPVNLFQALLSISSGLIKAAKIIFSVFLVTGAFQVVNETGALEVAIDSLQNKFKNKTVFLIPIVLFVMSILGYLEIIVNQTIVFIPIGVIIARKLKLDPLVGLSMMYLGTYVGFIFGGFGPFTLQVAQTIAGVPVLSGIVFRTVFFVIALIATMIFLMRYVAKISKDPSKSVLGTDYEWSVEFRESDETQVMTWKQKLTFLGIFVTFGIYIYGAFAFRWSMNELNTVSLFLAIFAGLINGFSVNKIAKVFIDGCKMATYSALLIGFATAITIILTDGNIIHTLVYYASMPLNHASKMFSGIFIFFFNWIFNFFVPSGTGQAAVVIPILSPLGEVIGLSKQVIVSAYKYGDGITNLIVPTSGTLMGFIGIAKVPYTKWLKFIMPLIIAWTAIATVAIGIAVAINW